MSAITLRDDDDVMEIPADSGTALDIENHESREFETQESYAVALHDDSGTLDIVEKSFLEIEDIISEMQSDPTLKDMNIKKYDAAYRIGSAIKKIHENVRGRDEKSKANERIKKLLRREKQSIQYYKQLTYFEKDLSLAEMGIANISKLSGNLKNYREIIQQDIKNIKDALLMIDATRCQDEDSLREFQTEIATRKSSAFCKDVILQEAKKHFDNDYSHILSRQDGLTVSTSKQLYATIKDEAKYEFEESLQNIDKKKPSPKNMTLKTFESKYRTCMEKLESLFYDFGNEELIQCMEAFKNDVQEVLDR